MGVEGFQEKVKSGVLVTMEASYQSLEKCREGSLGVWVGCLKESTVWGQVPSSLATVSQGRSWMVWSGEMDPFFKTKPASCTSKIAFKVNRESVSLNWWTFHAHDFVSELPCATGVGTVDYWVVRPWFTSLANRFKKMMVASLKDG